MEKGRGKKERRMEKRRGMKGKSLNVGLEPAIFYSMAYRRTYMSTKS